MQKFYESLSIKARPKSRSPSQSSFQDEDLGQRLEAKLQAAEQKRLSILANAQMRLAKLDELRQAAKIGAEMRLKKKRAELGTKVESRVQQAEVNRMLLHKAYSQRRATLKERTSQSLLRRMVRESKYKERVRAAISQKRSAAEKKRLGLLEAERRRARAKVLQAQKIAKSVCHQREIERKEMEIKLENKLQRAKRQRAEYLMQRGKQHQSARGDWNKIMDLQAEILSRKLTRCWRQFTEMKKTTLHLARAYDALNINLRSVRSMPFEQLALKIESSETLQTAKALLDRLEIRYQLFRDRAASSNSATCDDIDHLLKRVATPKKRPTPRRSVRNKEQKSPVSAKSPVKLARYQVRIVLCAYMIIGHPDAVLSSQGDRERALANSAEILIGEFELLVKVILDGTICSNDKDPKQDTAKHLTFRTQLVAFDSAWCSYLNSFVVWKVKDAQSLEDDLVRAACQLEVSMIQTCKMTPEGGFSTLTHDMKAVQKQVNTDQNLLREKVHHLSGDAGIERMENAISATRTEFFHARENGILIGSPVAHIVSPNTNTTSSANIRSPPITAANIHSPPIASGNVDNQRTNRVKRSLFGDDFNAKDAPSSSSHSVPVGETLEMENELIVNEIMHGQHPLFGDSNNPDDLQHTIKMKVKETMEKAFWDGIMESMKQDIPNYDRIVDLTREVRDELSGMSPQRWREGIVETIDLEILSQVLNSGKLDMEYLGKILDFALITLRKLSAPANDDKLRATHEKFMKEIAEMCQDSNEDSDNRHVIALLKGLRFLLEQIQGLKEEISKARIQMFEPFLNGPVAIEYLRKAFTSRYGSPSDALVALPITKKWLCSLKDGRDAEWLEYRTAFADVNGHDKSSPGFLPSTALRTGGSFAVKTNKDQTTSSPGSGSVLPECKGDKLDLSVRLGLLKMVSGVSGLSQDSLPETLKLNLLRLRSVQSRMQKIIVIATSILVLRQVLLSEQMLSNLLDMENIILGSVEKLSELLDSNENAGIKTIIEMVATIVENNNPSVDMKKLQSMKEMMARMLVRSLQAGDVIFIRVSRAIYVAARAVVLGGTGAAARAVAESVLRQVGAAVLVDEIVKAASTLVVAAKVSVDVHGPWYSHLIENM
ncbi:microtubule or microtubule-binding cytoskeletal protein [Lithospermum erythrorhizon]|uniref:Microtubule or microtubule-binding cytoskeletal protein n=1 Tax=Lithospermum erythrorhizon TaxID=34254 RepID=A0AAV3QGX4_LITER